MLGKVLGRSWWTVTNTLVFLWMFETDSQRVLSSNCRFSCMAAVRMLLSNSEVWWNSNGLGRNNQKQQPQQQQQQQQKQGTTTATTLTTTTTHNNNNNNNNNNGNDNDSDNHNNSNNNNKSSTKEQSHVGFPDFCRGDFHRGTRLQIACRQKWHLSLEHRNYTSGTMRRAMPPKVGNLVLVMEYIYIYIYTYTPTCVHL